MGAGSTVPHSGKILANPSLPVLLTYPGLHWALCLTILRVGEHPFTRENTGCWYMMHPTEILCGASYQNSMNVPMNISGNEVKQSISGVSEIFPPHLAGSCTNIFLSSS